MPEADMFNFLIFEEMVEKVFSGLPSNWPYSLPDTLKVFHYYFTMYALATGEVHPHLKQDQVRSMVMIMPYFDAENIGNTAADVQPEEYESIINQHFNTKYQKGCNYRLAHFFSGSIRKNRWYEI